MFQLKVTDIFMKILLLEHFDCQNSVLLKSIKKLKDFAQLQIKVILTQVRFQTMTE
jgi:hypothetical protein